MLYNYLFVLMGACVDLILNICFPAAFAFEKMYFVPCIGLCALILTVRKMDKVDAIILVVLFGIMSDFFYAPFPCFYMITYLLIYTIVYIWQKLVNESVIEGLVLCVSTIFIKEVMVYLFMKISGYTLIGFHTFMTNRLFLTILVNAVLVFVLILLAYIKDDLQKQKDVRIRREERLPWLH